ncbi:MAG: hypothetical protein M3Z96_04935, partial [Pseudomonadota bacterium]|nr:hypothetical protein [Pseudomonadota bacterium]
AIAVGFLASGLHQLIFHPLFVAPFIVRLWASGRRPLALVYIVGYSFICLFWISYWQIMIEALCFRIGREFCYAVIEAGSLGMDGRRC